MKNLFSVEGKVALVTGGSRGIGLMIARAFVECGVRTYISSRKADICDRVAGELSEHGSCISLPADLSCQDGIKALADEIGEREDALNILVNNAGAAWGAPFDEFPEIGWDKVMDLNVKSPFFLTQALIGLLQAAANAKDPARVINIGSIDGIGTPFLETYSYPASKAAIHQLTRVMAQRLASRHINVNAVAPGLFPSEMTDYMLDNYRQQITAKIPRGRVGEPQDMAGVAIYLSSMASAFVTGAIIPVDGGSLVA